MAGNYYQDRIAGWELERKQLEALLARRQQELQALTIQAVADINRQIQAKSDEVDATEQELASRKQQIETKKLEISQKREQISTIELHIEDMKTQAQTNLDLYNQMQGNLREKVSVTFRVKKELEEQRLRQANDRLYDAARRLAGQKASLQTGILSTEGDIARIEGSLPSLIARIGRLQAEITALEGAKQSPRDTRYLRDQVASLVDRIRERNERINDLLTTRLQQLAEEEQFIREHLVDSDQIEPKVVIDSSLV
jgi:chromosome segregation ATPase